MGEIVLAITSFSMALVPVLDYFAAYGAQDVAKQEPNPVLGMPPPQEHVDAIVIGCGRVGRLVSEMLTRHGVKHIIVEKDPRSRRRAAARRASRSISAMPRTRCSSSAAASKQAKGVVITINKPAAVDEIVAAVRELRDDIIIVARARDAEHARQLYKQKVSDAVPETIEASLQLSEATLVGLGVPTGPGHRLDPREARRVPRAAAGCRRAADAGLARQPAEAHDLAQAAHLLPGAVSPAFALKSRAARFCGPMLPPKPKP